MRSLIFATLVALSPGVITAKVIFINNTTVSFSPVFGFETEDKVVYQCNSVTKTLEPGEHYEIPESCFKNGNLLRITAVQTKEPSLPSYCPEFEPPLSNNDDITIVFDGNDPDQPVPANGICEKIKHNVNPVEPDKNP